MFANTKKNTAFALLFFLFWEVIVSISAFAQVDIPELQGRKQKFLITAYYSPLPNQSRYVRGTYEADIRLNGKGTNGADGTSVYPGMLAAPKTYPFGTKIEIPGFGIGSVHDRGGAILAHEDYDRLDIWMGHGEEGLGRALQWGARMVEATIYESTFELEDTLNYEHISPASLALLPQPKGMFSRSLFVGAQGEEVRKLQKYLKQLEFFNGPETGNFGPLTEQAVIDFQLAVKIISSPTEHGFGVVGPKTQSILERELNVEEVADLPMISPPAPQTSPALQASSLDLSLLPVGMGKGSSGPEIKKLQLMLHNLGYFDGGFSEDYNDQTIDAVFQFQKDHEVVQGESDLGAGHLGPRTHTKLSEVLGKSHDQRKNFKPQEISELVEIERDFVFGETLKGFIEV